MHMDRDQGVCVSASATLSTSRFRRARRFGRQCLLALLALLWGMGLVHATTYYYDGGGRLVVATRNDGTSARYVYDDLGNLQQIVTIPAGQLSIFGFTPNHGPVGTTVTLSGQGFSTTAASNAVTFNGVASTVLSATATTLVTTVPVGATTGSIAVTIGTATATSIEPFVIDANGAPPTIDSVTPTLVAPGATVTIAGQHFAPVPGQTSVTLDGQAIATSAVTDTTISFVVPPTVGSGHVAVQTPFGVAVSAVDVVVVPTSIGAATIGATGRIAIGDTQALTIPPSKNGALLFDAAETPDHEWLSLQLNALGGVSDVTYYVYDPRNTMVASGTLSTSSPSLHLPKLTKLGTYSLYLEPSSSTPTTTLTLGLEADPQLVLNAGAPTPAMATVANQSKRYVLQASPGSELVFAPVVTNPASQGINVSIRLDYGSEVSSTSSSASSFIVGIPFLITGRTYQVVVSPVSGASENVSVMYQQEPGTALTIDGPTVNTTVPPGSSAFYSFAAAAGDNLELALSGLALTPTGYYDDVAVYDSTGKQIAANLSCGIGNPGGSCRLTLSNLVAGTYAVTTHSETAASTASYQLTLTRDVTGTLTSGEAQTFNLTWPGQSLRLNFTGNAGDTVAIGLSHLTTTPAGKSVAITVTRPDGTTWVNGTEFSADGAINLPNLPTTGVYTVAVNPDYGLPASLQLVLAPNPGGTLVADGPSQSVSTFTGQNAYFAFTAAAGDNLELGLSSLTMSTTSCSYVDVAVYDSQNNLISSGGWYPSNPRGSQSWHLWGVTAGTYSVVLSECPFTGEATLTRDVAAPLAVGQPLSYDLTRPGQTVRLGFTGSVGQTLSVSLGNLVTNPSGNDVTFRILKPDGSVYANTDTAAASVFNLPNLPVAGTYTVIVSPDYGLPASFQVSLLSQVGGVLTVDGASQSVTAAVGGQNAYLTFAAATGDDLEIGLSDLTVNGSTCLAANVYDAANSNVGNAYWFTSNPGASARMSLWNLAGGTYTVVLSGCSGTTAFSGTVTLTRDLTGTLTVGGSQSIDLSRPGQTERLSFAGTAGQTLAVALENPVTTPSGKNITFKVMKPDGTQYASTDVGSATAINLQNLPNSGTYTVIISPDYGLPTTAQVSLLPQAGGPLVADGPSEAVSTAPGQSAYFSFTAAAGENLELGLSGLTATGSTCVNVYVYDPSNSTVGSTTWSTANAGGSTHISLWNLKAGAYTGVIADCTAGESFSGTLTLSHDLTGGLVSGGALAINLSRPGQAARLSFDGTAGQALTATLSNVVTTPAGQSLNYWILRPDGSLWVNDTVFGNKVTLSTLPATGTYMLILGAYYGAPVSMTVSLQ